MAGGRSLKLIANSCNPSVATDMDYRAAPKEVRRAHFIDRASTLHGGRFNYHLFDYIDAKTAGTIICPIHGEFSQTPDKHLASNSRGCQQCWAEARKDLAKGRRPVCRRETVSPEEFLRRARRKYGDRYQYDLSDYRGLTLGTVVVVCPDHGSFRTTPSTHLQKHQQTGCPKCGHESGSLTKTRSYDDFIAEASNAHGGRYTYPEENRSHFVNRRSWITVVCPVHGTFRKKAQKHLAGQGCWDCRVDELIASDALVGGYSEDLFRARPDLKKHHAILYYVEINGGELYKVGITRVSTDSRMRGTKCKAKGAIRSFRMIAEAEAPLYEAFQAEQFILKHCAAYRCIQPWSTEVFCADILPMLNPDHQLHKAA